MKRIISILCAIVMAVTIAMPVNANAAEGTGWIKVNGEEAWTYTDGQGTELLAKIMDNTLYVKGNGAIPAFEHWAMGNRPWHNKTIYKIVIEEGITSIGAHAFSDMKTLHEVTMPASAFIEETTAFGNIPVDSIFYFKGTNIVSRNIGNVPYTSLDSIVAFMQKYNGTHIYRMDNYYMTTWVQNSVMPKIDKLSPVDANSKYYNPNYPIINAQSEVSFVTPKTDYTMNVSIVSKQQGKLALEIFSIVLGDKTYATAYNMSVHNWKGEMKYTDAPITYKMTIPAAYQFPGRKFTLIQLGDGVVNFLEDEDVDETTLTFTTNYPSTVYGLVYQDTALVATEMATEQ